MRDPIWSISDETMTNFSMEISRINMTVVSLAKLKLKIIEVTAMKVYAKKTFQSSRA